MRGFQRAYRGCERAGRSTWNNRSELVPAEIISGNYFSVLGVRAAVGRVLAPDDDTVKDGNPVAVLSYSYWTASLGGDRGVLNQTLSINGHPFTVVGVAASGFSSALWGTTPNVFVPMSMKREITPDWDDLADRRGQWLNIIGRLKPGETRVAAEASVNPVWYAIRSDEFKQLKTQTPRAREAFLGKTRLMLFDGAKGFSPLRGDMQNPLLVVMGMVILVLTMACVNTASLLLVRAAGRTAEFSMRYALGASRGRVLRQLLLEGVLLGLLGGIVGVLFAPDVVRVLAVWISGGMQTPFSTSLDPAVLAFAAGATLLVSIVFSLAPAAQFWKPDLLEAMRRHGSTSSVGSLFFRRTCVTVQIGLSLLLLVGAGLFVRTIQNLRLVDTGIRLDHLIMFQINPRFSGYTEEQAAAARKRVLDRVGALPGVRSVSATSDPELAGDNTSGDIVLAGYTAKEDEDMTAELPFVTPGYFSTLGIPLLAGREFTDGDGAASQRVAIVNEALARKYFGSAQNAIGRSVGRKDKPDERIVGVVTNSRHTNPRDPVTRTLFQAGAANGQRKRVAVRVHILRTNDDAARVRDEPGSENDSGRRSEAGGESPAYDGGASGRYADHRANHRAAGVELRRDRDAAGGHRVVWRARVRHRAADARSACVWRWARNRPRSRGWCCAKFWC